MPTSNPYFVKLLVKIQMVIPSIMFIWILITYIISAIISIYSISLPLIISIPISIVIQISRFLVVFTNFLNNPAIFKSEMPNKIALISLTIALCELLFSLWDTNNTWAESASIFLFFASILMLGYFLEINFIRSAELVLMQSNSDIEVKKNGLKQQ
jgi:hypothetical protein